MDFIITSATVFTCCDYNYWIFIGLLFLYRQQIEAPPPSPHLVHWVSPYHWINKVKSSFNSDNVKQVGFHNERWPLAQKPAVPAAGQHISKPQHNLILKDTKQSGIVSEEVVEERSSNAVWSLSDLGPTPQDRDVFGVLRRADDAFHLEINVTVTYQLISLL